MACDGIVGVAPPDDVAGQLKAIAAVVRTNFAGSSWRLLPFAIVALALPFVLKPLVTGTPALPEPRCAPPSRAGRWMYGLDMQPHNSGAAEPGDADYDAADTGDVGCVPGFASSADVPRKGKKAR